MQHDATCNLPVAVIGTKKKADSFETAEDKSQEESIRIRRLPAAVIGTRKKIKFCDTTQDRMHQEESIRIRSNKALPLLALEENESPFDKVAFVTAATMKSNTADEHYAQNDYETAFKFYEETYKILLSIPTRDCPLLLHSLLLAAFNAGKCLHLLERLDHALHFYHIIANTANSSHLLATEKTIVLLQRVAWAFHQGEDSFGHACTFYMLALRIAQKVLGEEHTMVYRILNKYGNLLIENERVSAALKCYKKSLQIEGAIREKKIKDQGTRQNITSSYLESLTTFSNICYGLELQDNWEQFISWSGKTIRFLQCPEVIESISLSTAYRRSAAILCSMGLAQMKIGKSDAALETLSRALRIQRQEYGDVHSLVAVTINEIGTIHGNLGQMHLALQSFKESMRIRVRLGDPEDSNIATVLYNMARIHTLSGQSSTKALVCLKEVVEHERPTRQ